MTETMEQNAPAPPTVAGASFSPRAMALLIDLAALAFLNSAFVSLLGGTLFRNAPGNLWTLVTLSGALLAVALLVPPVVGLAYCTIFHACGGQTIGKLLLGLRVEDAAGGPLPWDRAFLRAVGQFGSALPLAAGFLWVLVDRERRAWHDYLALSRVAVVEKSLDKEPAIQ
ncbi:MAG TPA: RDD family protein [Desulfurivibrionaceae bacterium]|nr:RDD family protein [Desulfurivibrionaceae bacterium]